MMGSSAVGRVWRSGRGDLKLYLLSVFSLAVAFVLTVPVNRWLISRGRGHAVVHELHGHGGAGPHVHH